MPYSRKVQRILCGFAFAATTSAAAVETSIAHNVTALAHGSGEPATGDDMTSTRTLRAGGASVFAGGLHPEVGVARGTQADPGPLRQRREAGRPTEAEAERRSTSKAARTTADPYDEAVEAYQAIINQPQPQSEWQHFSDLSTWGWQKSTRQSPFEPLEDLTSIREPFKGIGIKPQGHQSSEPHGVQSTSSQGDTLEEYWEQAGWVIDGKRHTRMDLEYKGQRKEYKAIRLLYAQTLLPSFGVIVVRRAFSLEAKKGEYEELSIPITNIEPWSPLTVWSDVVFLSWQNVPEASRKPLEWIFDLTFKTDAEFDIGKRAMEASGENVKPWPGTVFSTRTNGPRNKAMQALLGIPDSVGRHVVEMLAQHRDAFPNSVVDKVIVYNGAANPKGEPEYCMAIHIASKKKI